MLGVFKKTAAHLDLGLLEEGDDHSEPDAEVENSIEDCLIKVMLFNFLIL